MNDVKIETRCVVCLKISKQECSHVECPNRKRYIANIPDFVSSHGVGHGRYYKITYQDK
jgi:hypothetical protein